jgi:hypothetical protein
VVLSGCRLVAQPVVSGGLESAFPNHSRQAVLVLGLVGDCTLGKLLAGCSHYGVMAPGQVVKCTVGRLCADFSLDLGSLGLAQAGVCHLTLGLVPGSVLLVSVPVAWRCVFGCVLS